MKLNIDKTLLIPRHTIFVNDIHKKAHLHSMIMSKYDTLIKNNTHEISYEKDLENMLIIFTK